MVFISKVKERIGGGAREEFVTEKMEGNYLYSRYYQAPFTKSDKSIEQHNSPDLTISET